MDRKEQSVTTRKTFLTTRGKRLLESMGLSTKRITKATIRADWKRKAKALTLNHRQLILDLFRQGKTIGEVAKEAQVDYDTVCGVLDLNTDYIPILRSESR